MEHRDTGHPQNISHQYPVHPRKTPIIAGFQRSLAPLAGFQRAAPFAGGRGKAPFCSTEWRAFFVSCVIPVGHVRQHAPSFHALLSRNHIHSAAKNSKKDEWFNPRKTPIIAGIQRSLAPLAGFQRAAPFGGSGAKPPNILNKRFSHAYISTTSEVTWGCL